jgi:hypothetical protein
MKKFGMRNRVESLSEVDIDDVSRLTRVKRSKPVADGVEQVRNSRAIFEEAMLMFRN